MTPEQEEQVRRALGSLPPEGPVPADVAARLDATLADLVAERTDGSAAVPTDDLAARRRRNRWRTGLVAAASVAVLGVGIGTVLDDLTQGEADQATSGEAASDAGGARELAPEQAPQDSAGGDADAPKAADAPDGVQYLATERQDVSSSTLDRDVARVAALTPVRAEREGGLTTDGTAPEANGRTLAAIAPCAMPATRAGDQLAPVRLDGQRATLLLRPADDGTREAQIYSCDDGDDVLASTVVPAR